MKRCPQCEFIYEDTQSLCDMDGRDLIYDEQAPSEAAAPAAKPVSRRSRLKRSPVLSLVGIVLGVVVLAVGYASVDSAITSKSDLDSGLSSAIETQQISPAPVPVVAVAEPLTVDEDQGEEAGTPENVVRQVKTTAARSQVKVRRASEKVTEPDTVIMTEPNAPKSAPAPAPARRELVVARPVAAKSSKDKIASALKKTGRFLTKPFKL
ncbi:MAG: hypothetical protein ABI967_06270 [bacterium]